METPIMMPSLAISSNTTPYATAPSSPHRLPTFFYSAPTSPTHHNHHAPFLEDTYNYHDNDFAFDFSGHIESPSISAADELFDCGIIKPLNPNYSFSPCYKNRKSSDYFIETFHQTSVQNQTTQNPTKRGTQTTTTTRTRISDILSEEDQNNQKNTITWYNKWNLKNLLLFRSASEGSATRSKIPVNKYSRITKCNEDVKNSSFRSADSCSMRKVSAHEMHYMRNRAMAEEMKKKTYLPYKSGLFGCLGFHNNGGSVHEISRGITSVMKQRGY